MARCGNPNPASDGDALVRRAEIELLLAEHSWEQALAAADQYHARLRGIDNPAWGPWRSLKALALDGLERREEACALLEQELEAAHRWGAPGALARTLRLLGTLRREDGHDLLREAVLVAESSPARLEHAKALVALGSALRRAGRRSESREPLRLGFELASRCGATPLADWARTELHSAGARPRREALSGPESLTPSERRVAELAAEGRSNRDIAQTLYVTPKTVEVHLTSIYRKLGISTRATLADALAQDAA
jgi:DNA-binding NarL/FixJ family response regulator